MRFGLGSEMEQWLYERRLFWPAALLVALLAALFVLYVWLAAQPEPVCGAQEPVAGECQLNVNHGQ